MKFLINNMDLIYNNFLVDFVNNYKVQKKKFKVKEISNSLKKKQKNKNRVLDLDL